MDSWTRIYLGSLLAVLTIIGVVPAQDDAVSDVTLTTGDLDLNDVVVDVEASADPDEAVESTAPQSDVARVVHLNSDGRLEGRLSIVYATGKRLPADAQIKFTQAGEVVDETSTNESGEFEIAGFKPGTYLATASIESGSTDFSVNVLPYDENTDPEQMILDATLTPTPEVLPQATCVGCGAVVEGTAIDGYVEGGIVEGDVFCDDCLVEEVIVDEYAPCAMGACCGGFSGGGGCCGGGGLGWLLGAGGLATGITALALNRDDGVVVLPTSPAEP